ncbi:DUF2007 domain-containing protein [Chryseolinea sp. T2]|uniref:putative signal transducing protein n=1 Tax=Chryseolinea sp. T2 TaxID=3129255 RepID=UPI003077CE19
MIIDETQQKDNDIVVFRTFRDAITANIVKSKLDAFGIPCFLTEENLSNLYPGASALMNSQVRLHLFQHDVESARQVLSESNLVLQDETVLHCPACHSTNIERDFPRRLSQNTLSALRYIFFGIFSPEKKVYRCANCDFEF